MQVLNRYGPTECTIDVTSHFVQADDPFMVIGKPMPNCLCYVVDETMSPVDIRQEGELLIGGIQVARGYIGRPELTAERFIDNPFGQGRVYKTGDLVSWTENGALICHGRIDSQVKLRGQRMEMGGD